MTTHPDTGEWRAWLDQDSAAPELDTHLADCAGCRAVVNDLRDAADYASGSVALLSVVPPTPAEVTLARTRLEQWRGGAIADAGQLREPVALSAWRRVSAPWRVAGGAIAAAIALSLVVSLTPQGQAAAAGFLAQFRSQQVAAIEVTPQTQTDIMRTLSALGNLGTVQIPNGANPNQPETTARNLAKEARTVSLAEANQAMGFKVQTPDPASLPANVDRSPTVRLMPSHQIRFTFDKKKATSYYESKGQATVSLPDKFDGATLAVSMPSATLLEYAGTGQNREVLVVGQAGELVVDVEGGKVSLDEMRDFLLGLPGLPASTVNQLKQLKNWNQTLPIPVPIDIVNWQTSTFKGNPGLLLNDNSGVASAAIWHESGHLVGIAGSLKANELKRVAESLAVR